MREKLSVLCITLSVIPFIAAYLHESSGDVVGAAYSAILVVFIYFPAAIALLASGILLYVKKIPLFAVVIFIVSCFTGLFIFWGILFEIGKY